MNTLTDYSYMVGGPFGRLHHTVLPPRRSVARPTTAYHIETHLRGYDPFRMRVAPQDFTAAYRAFFLLASAAEDAGYGREAVQWTVEY